MRKLMVLGALVAMMVTALALPAFADDRNDWWEDREDENLEELFFVDSFFFPGFFFDEDEDPDGFLFDEDEDFDGFNGELNQDVEQDAESGEVDQSFDVSQTGDNSNQCAGIQGVSNTGNAQNVIDLTQVDGEADDFEFDEVDSSIEVSPTNTTSCDSQVNQAATAAA